MLYITLQFVGVFAVVIFDAITGKLVLPDTQDANKMAEELTSYIMGIAIPSLIVGAVIFFIIFILYKVIRKHEFDIKSINWNTLLGALGLGLIVNVVITLIVNLIAPVLPNFMNSSLDQFTGMALTGQSFWLIMLGTGIIAPILEELTFRYGICGTIGRKNTTAALIISSLVFGVVHANPIQIAYATIIGIILGLTYLKGKNIWYPIVVHIAINSSTVIVACTGLAWLHAVWAVLGIVLILIAFKINPELKHFFAKKDEY